MTDVVKPSDAPEHCPGTQSEDAGKASACAGCPNQKLCASGATKGPDPGIELVRERLEQVQNKILVLSGKGGVGKSTLTALLSRGLALGDAERNVAVLDIDICGPSQPRVLGVAGEQVHQSGSGWSPVYVEDNLSVMSIGFLLSSVDDAIIWRGPKKNGMIRQFLSEVDWGKLDYLLMDTPPDAGIHGREWIGTAQALYIINQLVENPDNEHLVENIDWVVIPLVNPDGYEYSHEVDRLWRKTRSKQSTCYGVDPNRNFDYQWGGPGSSDDECSDIYAGPVPFSEPETVSLSKAIQKYSDRTKLYLTMHNPGSSFLYPWGYSGDVPENAAELDKLGKKVAKAIRAVNGTRYKVGSSFLFMEPTSGSSRDWAYGSEAIKLAYTVDLPAGGKMVFDIPLESILSIVEEMFVGIKVFHEYIEEKFVKS